MEKLILPILFLPRQTTVTWSPRVRTSFHTVDALFCDLAMDLDIHLNCGDTVMGTCYLEVHVTEEVLQALDIGQDEIIVIGLACYQTAGDTCNRFLIGTPAAIRDRVDAQMLAWDVEPLDSIVSDTVRIAYGNSSSHGSTGISARSASAPWPISRRPGPLDGLCLTYGEGWEVVLMHVTFGGLELIQSVQFLCFGKRSQCCYVADLSLSTGEHCRAMYARDQINLCSQRTDLGNLTAIRTLVVL